MINVHCESDVSALSTRPTEGLIEKREIGNVEVFQVIYVSTREDEKLDCLSTVVNRVRHVQTVKNLISIAEKAKQEKFIIIINIDQVHPSINEFYHRSNISMIYLLAEEADEPSWANEYANIVGVYRNFQSIRDDLLKNLCSRSSHLTVAEMVNDDTTETQTFTYCQLLKETMLCTDDESDLKKDMIAFCRVHYADNTDELNNIDEFEKQFTEDAIVRWWTRSSFISKVLHRALITQEIDLIFKMRYAMQTLQKWIKTNSLKTSTTVYVLLEPLDGMKENFQKNEDGLVIFRSFLPAFYQPSSFLYDDDRNQDKRIILSIELSPNNGANITDFCSADFSADVLIGAEAIFRIGHMNNNDDGIFTVHLESVPSTESYFQSLTKQLREEMAAPVVILQTTKLLLATNHKAEIDFLTELIFQDGSFGKDKTLLSSLAAAHHLIGNVDEDKNPKMARHQFFKSLRVFKTFLPSDHQMMSSTYNNIGSMYYKEDLNEQAIVFHRKAFHCQMKASSPDVYAVGTYAGNLGAVYLEQGKYADAEKNFSRALKILEKSPKKSARHIISIYQKASTCRFRLRKYDEAIEYYKKTLEYQQQLPNSDHSVSVTYYNMATAYAELGDLNKAIEVAEQSVKYLRQCRDENDPEIADNEGLLEGFRQKLWLKELLDPEK